jgi:hypothetical protein
MPIIPSATMSSNKVNPAVERDTALLVFTCISNHPDEISFLGRAIYLLKFN